MTPFLDLLVADSKTDFRVKLMERLKYKIYELLEKAINWWGEQDVLDSIWR